MILGIYRIMSFASEGDVKLWLLVEVNFRPADFGRTLLGVPCLKNLVNLWQNSFCLQEESI